MMKSNIQNIVLRTPYFHFSFKQVQSDELDTALTVTPEKQNN